MSVASEIEYFSSGFKTLGSAIAARLKASGDTPVFLSQQRAPITGDHLRALIDLFNRLPRHRDDARLTRWALAFEDRLMAACSFIATVPLAGAVPLNTKLKQREFEEALCDPLITAIVCDVDTDHALIAAARAKNIAVYWVHYQNRQASDAFGFSLSSNWPETAGSQLALPSPEDAALILSTSGTTGRPKRVPLSNANLVASIERLSKWLQLGADDCCLTVMPLFHIHGLICCMLAPVLSGGQAYIVEDLSPANIWSHLHESKATWVTAVPTIHAAVLAYARDEGLTANAPQLRLIRSSSAAMQPTLFEGLSSFFKVPVVEAYGMTEASHQMASNPLPPREAKPGTVGIAASTEIQIVDGNWQALPVGEVGEVTIKGPSVTSGYEHNSAANDASFRSGWFRTGDEGYLDHEGYLTLTGRVKEMINRGGEKVAPLEVDRILTSHPEVREAITFALPHPTLGEEVAAAVILEKTSALTAVELGAFAANSLAGFKVPTRIEFVDDIPKGPTGKLQRIGLGDALGLIVNQPADKVAGAASIPKSAAEVAFMALVARVIGQGLAYPSRDLSFLENGGDSLQAARLVADVQSVLLRSITLAEVLAPTPLSALSRLIYSRVPSLSQGAERPKISSAVERLDASYGQRLLWGTAHLQAEDQSYTLVSRVTFKVDIEKQAMAQAIERLVAHRPVLKTHLRYHHNVLSQHFVSETDAPIISIEGGKADGDEFKDWVAKPINISAPFLWEICLLTEGKKVSAIVLKCHHALADGIGRQNMIEAIWKSYVADDLDDVDEITLIEHFIAQEQYSADQANDVASSAYWSDALDHLYQQAQQIGELTKPDAQIVEEVVRDVELGILRGLENKARENNVTFFSALLKVFADCLMSHIEQSVITIGVPFARRGMPNAEAAIAYLSQTLPFVFEVADKPTDWLAVQAVQDQAIRAASHQWYPVFHGLAQKYPAARHMSNEALLPFIFQYRAFDNEENGSRGQAAYEVEHITPTAVSPLLEIDTYKIDGALRIRAKYQADHMDEGEISDLLIAFEASLTLLAKT